MASLLIRDDRFDGEYGESGLVLVRERIIRKDAPERKKGWWGDRMVRAYYVLKMRPGRRFSLRSSMRQTMNTLGIVMVYSKSQT